MARSSAERKDFSSLRMGFVCLGKVINKMKRVRPITKFRGPSSDFEEMILEGRSRHFGRFRLVTCAPGHTRTSNFIITGFQTGRQR